MSKSKKNSKVEPKKSIKPTPTEEDTPKQKIDNPNVKILKDIFSNWTDEDLLSALNDYNGDLNLTISRISEGHATQWSTFKKNEKVKKAEQPKPSEEKTSKPFSNGPKFGDGERPPKNEKYQGNNQGNLQGKPKKFEKFDKKPRDDLRKKEVVSTTTDWSSAVTWESQPSTSTTIQPSSTTTTNTTTPTSSTSTTVSVAPWADKSKINQPTAPVIVSESISKPIVTKESEQLMYGQPSFSSQTLTHHAPQQQPSHVQNSQTNISPVTPKVVEKVAETPKPIQESSRIPTSSAIPPVSKPVPQPQLPPPMTNPNAFKAISRQNPQEKSGMEGPGGSLPSSLRFGTTGLSGEELPPIDSSQRIIKKEDSQIKTQNDQFQNPPGFGMNIGLGLPENRDWQRGVFPQPTVSSTTADQSFKNQDSESIQGAQQPPQQPMGGYLYSYPFQPFYTNMGMGMYPPVNKMYQQMYMTPAGNPGTTRPIPSNPQPQPQPQPGMPYPSNDFSKNMAFGYTGRPTQAIPSNNPPSGQEFKTQPSQPSQPTQPQMPHLYSNYRAQGQNYGWNS